MRTSAPPTANSGARVRSSAPRRSSAHRVTTTRRARAAADEGASYIAFGAFFPSPTKPGARAAPLSLLREHAGGPLPVVAIGGITPDNAPAVVAAGADLVAAITGVFDAADPAAAVRAYGRAFAP